MDLKEKIIKTHTEYVNQTKENYPNAKIFTLEEIYKNVEDGLSAYKENVDNKILLENVASVLEHMVITSKSSVPEMIKRAEEDYASRYERMTEEQKKVCENYRLNY